MRVEKKQFMNNPYWFQCVYDSTDNIILWVDAELEILESNRIGKLFLSLQSDDSVSFPINSSYFQSPDVRHVRMEYPKHSNEFQLVNWTIFPSLSGKGKPVALLLGCPVSQEHEWVDVFNKVIENMPGCFYWKGRDGYYRGCNNFLVKTVGLSNKTDIVGKTDIEIWPESGGGLRKNDLRIMASGESELLVEKVEVIPGKKRFFSSFKVPLTDSRNHDSGIAGCSWEITEIKEAQIVLEQAKEKLERFNCVKDEFIRNMEHDIRTPFSGIYGMATSLMDIEEDPIKRHYAQSIAESSKELLDYCNKVIEFSRIDAGETPEQKIIFNLNQLVQSVVTIQTPTTISKNIKIALDYEEGLPLMYCGDYQKIKCILLNLVGNAIKFTEEGFVKILVKSGCKVEGSSGFSYIEMLVEDSGIGIDPADHEHIFEKFVRLTESDQNIFSGQGLGLSIVKKFVEELSGEIRLESEKGQGTQLMVRLPLEVCYSE